MKRMNLIIGGLLTICITGTSLITIGQPTPWIVPDKYVNMPNPVKKDTK
jgi:hypothetical protein